MSDFASQLGKVLKSYSKDDFYEDLHSKFIDRLQIISDKNVVNFSIFIKLFPALVKAYPIITGLVTAWLFKVSQPKAAAAFGVMNAIIYILLAAVEIWMPKDISEITSMSREYNREKAIRILGSQIVFFLSLQNISYDDDEDRIKKLSNHIDSQLTEAIKSQLENVKQLTTPGHHNKDVNLSAVEVNNIPQDIYDNLEPLGENISEACKFIFGPAEYSVKVYLKTKHIISEMDNTEVQMLTSFIKYPYKRARNKISGGRSWINCKGAKASVWSCVNDGEDVICNQDEVKRTSPKQETYPSIAYIRLPQGIGVLTIESSSRKTFADKNVFNDEIKRTLMITTDVFTRQALSNLNII